MEAAVREFLRAVGGYLRDCEASGDGTRLPPSFSQSSRQQLQLLRKQLQQLLDKYPSLRFEVTEDTYAEAEDVAGGSGSSASLSRGSDAGGSGSNGRDATGEKNVIIEELYDDTAAEESHPETETYDDLATPIIEEEYDEVAAGLSYVPMVKTDSQKLTDAQSRINGAPRPPLLINIGPPPDTPAPSLPSRLAKLATTSAPVSTSGSMPNISSALSVSSIPSAVGSDDSEVEPQPASLLRGVADRWGRLELKQHSILRPYRRFWGGLVGSRLLLYQKDTDQAQRLSVNMENYEVRRPPAAADVKEKHRPLCFELVKPGGKTHTLLALTPKDARQWVAALERAAALEGTSGDGSASSERPSTSRPPVPPPAEAVNPFPAEPARAMLPPVPTPLPPAQDNVIEESLYNIPNDEDMIYDDVELMTSPPREGAEEHHLIQEDIYEMIGNAGADDPNGAALGAETSERRPLPAPPSEQSSHLPSQPTGAAPALPPPRPPPREPLQPARSPRPPMRPPPSKTPAIIVLPRPTRPVPSPPTRNPASVPTQRPAAPPAGTRPLGEVQSRHAAKEVTEEVYDETAHPIEEELYDEMEPLSPPTPRSDPFYNVLESESAYNQPKHPSPVLSKTMIGSDEPADEGYGNSSAGSEVDCRSVGESHYKTLPLLRPVPVPTKVDGRTGLPQTTASALVPPVSKSKEDKPKVPTTLEPSSRAPKTTEPETKGGAKLSEEKQTHSGVKATGSNIRDVIARLNRQSASDDGGEPAPHSVTISSELARKQALIAGAVQRLGSASPTSPVGNTPITSTVASSAPGKPYKPTVTAPKPDLSSRGKKGTAVSPLSAKRTQNTPRHGMEPDTKGGKLGIVTPNLAPNKSGVYSAMRHSLERLPKMSLTIHPEPEEEDVYAEIDDFQDGEWNV